MLADIVKDALDTFEDSMDMWNVQTAMKLIKPAIVRENKVEMFKHIICF